jgi:DNA-binding NarL/FixJ family response regulator
VLVLVAKGSTNREIAERLVISEVTARNHVSHILEKLGVRRRSEAAVLASQLGLTGPAHA